MANVSGNNIEINITANATSANSALDAAANALGRFSAAAYKAAKEQYDANLKFNSAIAKATEQAQKEKVNIVTRTEQAIAKATEAVQKQRVSLNEKTEQFIARATERAQKAKIDLVEKTEKAIARATERQQKETIREIERAEKQKTKLIEQEAAKQKNARLTALQTIAHTIPFGIGRTAAFVGANFESFAVSSGMSPEKVEAFSAAISRIPIPVVAAVATAFILLQKAIDLAKEALERFVIPAIRKGLEYNDLIENSKFGIAGIVSQMTDLYDGQRKITDEAERWS